ncbi:MAG: hypothetical protein HQL28_06885, partial [Candidatus Omnitrophica bacterium]|nr:hypothetical protein [Candidatus Omnitrophota bacterium]
METNKRRNYFIKPKFQASFFAKFIMLLVLEAVVIALLFMVVSRGTLTTAYGADGLVIQKTGIYFLFDFILITIIAGAGIGVAGTFIFMYLTHRLGGPLYKFERTILEARKGLLSERMDLRKTDQLSELKDEINLLLPKFDDDV